MEKINVKALLSVLLTMGLCMAGHPAYADESPTVISLEDEIAVLDPTLYEADMADHYEQALIRKDEIDKSIS